MISNSASLERRCNFILHDLHADMVTNHLSARLLPESQFCGHPYGQMNRTSVPVHPLLFRITEHNANLLYAAG